MGHRICKIFNQDRENRKSNLTTAANRRNLMIHQMTVYKMNMSDKDWTRKRPSGSTVGNKKTMNHEKVSTEPIYCHPQNTGPNGTIIRH